jgi:hypothetical protein
LEELERNATGDVWIPGAAAAESPDSLTAWSRTGSTFLAKNDEQSVRLQRREEQKQKDPMSAALSAPTPAIVSGLPLRNQKRACGAHGGRAKRENVDDEENSEDEKESDDDKVSFARVFGRGPLRQPSHKKDKRRSVRNQPAADVAPDAGIAGALVRLEIVKQLRALKSDCRSSASQESDSSAGFRGSGGDGRNKLKSLKGLHRLLKSERKRLNGTVQHFCDVAQTALGVIAEYRKLLKELRSQNTLLRQGAPSNLWEEIEETEVDGDPRGAGEKAALKKRKWEAKKKAEQAAVFA